MPDYRATDSILIAPTELSVDQRIPIGEIDGIVVDAYRGSVVSHATIRVLYSDSLGKTAAVGSDDGGRFRLLEVKPGPAALQISYMGYGSQLVPISGDSGLVVRAGLHAVAMRLCGQIIRTAPTPAITVMVRDAQTGIAPMVPVTLRVRDGNFADSATGIVSAPASQMYPTDSLSLSAAPERNGKYDVRVTAPGYSPGGRAVSGRRPAHALDWKDGGFRCGCCRHPHRRHYESALPLNSRCTGRRYSTA
ncbi:MAG: carboxypeptidase-like regulatory domain-containing protein [Gemmatimonadota bacterium]|nr:carboxypeptidase-like regulatory domain-containing protein [Gemmatimonadota bacterium]